MGLDRYQHLSAARGNPLDQGAFRRGQLNAPSLAVCRTGVNCDSVLAQFTSEER